MVICYQRVCILNWKTWPRNVLYMGQCMHEMSDALQLDLHLHLSKFRQQCLHIVRSKFMKNSPADITDTSKHLISRTYRYIKSSFRTESYIDICIYMVKDRRYGRAISQLRCSSHTLNIERCDIPDPKLHSMKASATCAFVLMVNYICNCICNEFQWMKNVLW